MPGHQVAFKHNGSNVFNNHANGSSSTVNSTSLSLSLSNKPVGGVVQKG